MSFLKEYIILLKNQILRKIQTLKRKKESLLALTFQPSKPSQVLTHIEGGGGRNYKVKLKFHH